MVDPKPLRTYSIADAAAQIGLHYSTLSRHVREGRVPYRRYEGTDIVRFTDDDLQQIASAKHLLDADGLLTVAQAANALGMSRSKLYQLIREGQGPQRSLVNGRFVGYREEALEAYLSESLRPAVA